MTKTIQIIVAVALFALAFLFAPSARADEYQLASAQNAADIIGVRQYIIITPQTAVIYNGFAARQVFGRPNVAVMTPTVSITAALTPAEFAITASASAQSTTTVTVGRITLTGVTISGVVGTMIGNSVSTRIANATTHWLIRRDYRPALSASLASAQTVNLDRHIAAAIATIAGCYNDRNCAEQDTASHLLRILGHKQHHFHQQDIQQCLVTALGKGVPHTDAAAIVQLAHNLISRVIYFHTHPQEQYGILKYHPPHNANTPRAICDYLTSQDYDGNPPTATAILSAFANRPPEEQPR